MPTLGSSDCNVLMTKLENSFFTIDLSSNASLDCYPDNTLASFRTSLSAPLELDDNQWTVSLSSITCPKKFFNIVEGKFDYINGKLGIYLSNCRVPKGLYNSVFELIDGMEKGIYASRGQESIFDKSKKDFQFFPRKELTSKGVVVLCEGKDCVHLTNVSDDLRCILGLEKSPLETHNKPSSGNNQFEDKPVFPTDINLYHLAFVYCDIIEPQFVGNTKAPFLRSFPLSDATQIGPEKVESSIAGRFGYPAVYRHSFDKTQSKLVNKNYIHDNLIEIRSDTGKLIPFTGVGRTYATLFFHKISS